MEEVCFEMQMTMQKLVLENEELKRKLQVKKRIITQLETALLSENMFDHNKNIKMANNCTNSAIVEHDEMTSFSLADKLFHKLFSK